MEKFDLSNFGFVVPIKDESMNPTLFLHYMFTMYKNFEIVFVYEDEDEKSLPELVAALQLYDFNFIVNPGKGVASSLVCGFRFLQTEFVGVLLCDDIGPVQFLDKIVAESVNRPDSLLFGTRYRGSGKRLFSKFSQSIFSQLGNGICRLLFGLSDTTTSLKFGPRMIMESIYSVGLDTRGWEINMKVSMEALRRKLVINEFPFLMIDRMRFGESTFRLIPWLKTYSKILLKDIRFYRRKGVFIPYDYL